MIKADPNEFPLCTIKQSDNTSKLADPFEVLRTELESMRLAGKIKKMHELELLLEAEGLPNILKY